VAFRPTTFPPIDPNDAPFAADGIALNCEYYIYDFALDGVWQYFRLPTDPTILICVACGDFARRLDDMLPADATIAVRNVLTAAYPTGDFTPAANQVVVSNWTQAPYVHGAYSYTRYDDRLAPDNPIPFEARERIREPHGRIHFAGEATWTEAYGTIHGAYNSGVRAAQEILAAIAPVPLG
jgi:monoamine oxidase